MHDSDKQLLSKILTDRLLDNWDKCDSLPSSSEKYSHLTDECDNIHKFILEWNIPIGIDIAARF